MAQQALSLHDYANATYSKYKNNNYFHSMICALAHSYDVADSSTLVTKINHCDQTRHKKVSKKLVEQFLDDFAEEGLIMYGMDKKTITHTPTALGKLVLKIYERDPDIGERHKLPNF